MLTYYFRKTFTLTEDPDNLVLNLSHVIDDGAIVYVNGIRIYDFNLPEQNVDYLTEVQSGISNAVWVGPVTLDDVAKSAFVQGENTIAVEVHQASRSSSDIVFGLNLDATIDPNLIVSHNVFNLLDGLRISEINYNPDGSDATEFIELTNVSNKTLNLEGVEFTNGITFTFGDTSLAPGEYAIVVRVGESQTVRDFYDPSVPIVGEYTSKLDNGGERIELTLPQPFTANILDFSYDDSWYPETDAGNRTLTIVDTSADVDTWGQQSAWRASFAIHGTPGADDPELFGQNGDLNGDNKVGLADLLILKKNFGISNATLAQGDFNSDNNVDAIDLAFLLSRYRSVIPSSAPQQAQAASSLEVIVENTLPDEINDKANLEQQSIIAAQRFPSPTFRDAIRVSTRRDFTNNEIIIPQQQSAVLVRLPAAERSTDSRRVKQLATDLALVELPALPRLEKNQVRRARHTRKDGPHRISLSYLIQKNLIEHPE